ncbi:MAG: hypothetical protein US96_C0018G0011 [Candidatus Woesebacteria bacterium GW2011_GWB1_38_5b]|uniref:ECF transporter S component n=2 Tax=Candidatus Woeseibacteriota TaxID=1752722 RepID=A0A0G0MMX7_9BACT|nr:MAG: hypothetical protein US96_C0018G0011 [Candidatus Woesebacteria bacterium GW2011_GWB1_38_5b]OGM59472.1 MAG: hypothetical protein A2892_02390 [Candidatus Woesebacteria bacterium RIFCSPLOWO2_01_FULL_39_10b]
MNKVREQVYVGKSTLVGVMILVVCSAIYGGSLWATSFLPTIPGVTWLRPGNMLSEVFAVCFGWYGSLSAMLGNSFGDFLRGGFNPATLWWLLPLELIGTALVVFLGVTDPSLRSLRGKIEWVVFAVVFQGLLTGFGIAFFLVNTNIVPAGAFRTIGWTITLNEGVPAIAAGVIQFFLFPQIVKMGLWWGRDLEKSNVPKEFLAELRR